MRDAGEQRIPGALRLFPIKLANHQSNIVRVRADIETSIVNIITCRQPHKTPKEEFGSSKTNRPRPVFFLPNRSRMIGSFVNFPLLPAELRDIILDALSIEDLVSKKLGHLRQDVCKPGHVHATNL